MSVLEGALEPLKLFKIFRSLIERRATGDLSVVSGKAAKKICWREGRPTRVRSNLKRETLVGRLHDHGLLDFAQIEQVNSIRRVEQVGEEDALIRLGLVSVAELRREARALAIERVLDLFAWPSGGRYLFSRRARADEASHDTLDPIEILLRAAAHRTSDDVCRSFLADYPSTEIRYSRWADRYSEQFDALFPPPNVRTSLGDARSGGLRPIPSDARPREVFGLIISGLANFAKPAERETSESVVSTSTDMETSTAVVESNAARRPAGPRRTTEHLEQHATRIPIRRRSRSSTSMRAISLEEAKRRTAEKPAVTATNDAQQRDARDSLGTDRAEPAESSVQQISTDKQTTEKSSTRKRAIETNAAKGGTAGTSTAESSRAEKKTSTQKKPGSRSKKPVRTTSRIPKPSLPIEVPDDIRETLQRVELLAQNLRKRSHYELLGVPQSASTAEVRVAFRKLARDLHVDRFVRYRLADEWTNEVSQVFMAVNRAHNVLKDPPARTEYDLSLEMTARGQAGVSHGGADLAAIFKAEQTTRDGVNLIRNGKPQIALEKLEEALKSTPDDVLTKAAHAYAEILIAQSEATRDSARAAEAHKRLYAIVKDGPRIDQPYIFLGRVYRTQGRIDRAIDCFERALKVRPHNAEAASELRFLQRKAEKPEESSSTSRPKKGGRRLFGRFLS